MLEQHTIRVFRAANARIKAQNEPLDRIMDDCAKALRGDDNARQAEFQDGLIRALFAAPVEFIALVAARTYTVLHSEVCGKPAFLVVRDDGHCVGYFRQSLQADAYRAQRIREDLES